MSRKIDHIVYCVQDLDKAVDELHKKLGIRPSIGGRHLTEGTKNALLNLGDSCYLEILSVDHGNMDVKPPRWMGIDLISTTKVTRWAIKTEDSKKDSEILKDFNSEMGEVKAGSRKKEDGTKLEWDLVMPLSHPEVEVIPFMTDWTKSDVHPTDTLEAGCKLISLELVHPEVEIISTVLEQLNCNIDLKNGEKSAIYLYIETPNGIVKL